VSATNWAFFTVPLRCRLRLVLVSDSCRFSVTTAATATFSQARRFPVFPYRLPSIRIRFRPLHFPEAHSVENSSTSNLPGRGPIVAAPGCGASTATSLGIRARPERCGRSSVSPRTTRMVPQVRVRLLDANLGSAPPSFREGQLQVVHRVGQSAVVRLAQQQVNRART
jgi:hypothetical protein